MKQISHLSLYFFKKDKKQILSFGIIILITSLILNLATVLALRIDPAYDRQSDELHSADIDMVIPKMTDSAALSAAVRSHASVAQLEQQRAILQKAVMKDFRGTDFELNILFYNWDNHRSIHQLSLIERSEKTLSGENTIYLPLYIAKFGEYALNEKITFSMDGRDFTYTVAGVVQEMHTAMPVRRSWVFFCPMIHTGSWRRNILAARWSIMPCAPWKGQTTGPCLPISARLSKNINPLFFSL